MRYYPCPTGVLREGNTRYTQGVTPTDYQYTGQRNESALGLYFYNARWVDVSLGRFVQADTIIPEGGQGFDRYAYVSNSPMMYTDPSGHETCMDDYYWNGQCHDEMFPDPVQLTPDATTLIRFSEVVGLTPEQIIQMGIYHETAGWIYGYQDIFAQHLSNRFVWYAKNNCDGNLTRNCMLNFFMDTYQSIFDSLVDNYKDRPQDLIREQTWGDSYREAGIHVMYHFWVDMNPWFDPIKNPDDWNAPFDVVVVYADALEIALGHPPVQGVDFLVVSASDCGGVASYALIMTYGQSIYMEGIENYSMCRKGP